MTVDLIFPLPGRTAPLSPAPLFPMGTDSVPAVPTVWRRDRIDRLTALGPEDTAAGLLWLAMNFPAVCDAMLDKLEFDDIDDANPGQEPEPGRWQATVPVSSTEATGCRFMV
jgi:hypothetical protein